MALILP